MVWKSKRRPRDSVFVTKGQKGVRVIQIQALVKYTSSRRIIFAVKTFSKGGTDFEFFIFSYRTLLKRPKLYLLITVEE